VLWSVLFQLYCSHIDGFALASGAFSRGQLLSERANSDRSNSEKDGHPSLSHEEDNIAVSEMLSLIDTSVRSRGEDEGQQALDTLKELSQRRIPYKFRYLLERQKSNSPLSSTGLVVALGQVIPTSIVELVLQEAKSLEKYMSKNPDSVDGIPSMHLNLVVNGTAQGKMLPADQGEKDSLSNDPYQNAIHQLLLLIQPHIEKLLEDLRTLIGDNSLTVDEVRN